MMRRISFHHVSEQVQESEGEMTNKHMIAFSIPRQFALFLLLLYGVLRKNYVSAFNFRLVQPRPVVRKSSSSFAMMNTYLDSLSSINKSTSGDNVAISDKPVEPPVSVLTIEAEEHPQERDLSKSRTQRIMEKIASNPSVQSFGAGGTSTYEALLNAEERWLQLKLSKPFTYDTKLFKTIQNGVAPPTTCVTDDGTKGNPRCWEKLREQRNSEKLDYDVVVCGGTLGIFIALALQLKGFSVCVIEAGALRGRQQEWNLSRKELEELIEEGLLTHEEIERVITTEFPGCRAGFKNEEGERCMCLESNYFCWSKVVSSYIVTLLCHLSTNHDTIEIFYARNCYLKFQLLEGTLRMVLDTSVSLQAS